MLDFSNFNQPSKKNLVTFLVLCGQLLKKNNDKSLRTIKQSASAPKPFLSTIFPKFQPLLKTFFCID